MSKSKWEPGEIQKRRAKFRSKEFPGLNHDSTEYIFKHDDTHVEVTFYDDGSVMVLVHDHLYPSWITCSPFGSRCGSTGTKFPPGPVKIVLRQPPETS